MAINVFILKIYLICNYFSVNLKCEKSNFKRILGKVYLYRYVPDTGRNGATVGAGNARTYLYFSGVSIVPIKPFCHVLDLSNIPALGDTIRYPLFVPERYPWMGAVSPEAVGRM